MNWPGQKVGGGTPAQAPSQPAPQQQAPVQGGPALRPVLTLPDPKGDREEQRDEIRLDSTLQGDARIASKDQFDRLTTYRKEFLTDPVVRDFRTVQTATKQIIDLATRESDTPGPGDISLIFSFMKALDPNSVVREGEFATAENAGGVPETVMNAYNRLLEGGRLSPDLKREFANTTASIYNARLGGYNAFAEDYRGLVSAEGADPDAQGIRLAEPIAFGEPAQGGGQGYSIVTPEESAAAWGEVLYDENGNPVGNDYTGDSLYDAQGNYVSARISISDDTPDPRVQQLADEWEARNGPSGLSDLASQGITLGLADEAGAVGSTLGEALTGDFDLAGNYELYSQVERELVRRARERTGGFGTAAELLGGGGAVRGIGNAALNAGRAVAASGAPVSRAAIQSQLARQAGIEGAGVGATAGFGYGEGAQESALGAVVGGAGGYLLGRGGQALGNRSANRGGGSGGGGGSPVTPGGQVIQSADSFNAATGANVQPLPADVGGALTRRASGAVAQTTFGAKPLVEGAQAVNSDAQTGIRTLAGRQGNVPGSKQAGGEVAIKGAEKTMQRAKLKVDALYTKARKEAGNAELELPMASTVLQGHIDELSRVPGGGEGLSTLQTLADDIAGKRFPVDGIKAMRTQLRDKFLKDGLRGSDVERRVNEVIDAADLDIEDGLLAIGKRGAAQAYADASKAAAERFTLIDDVLAPVLGRKGEKSGEQAFAAIDQLARGDAVTLGKFMRALPQEEAGSIRGLVIDRLGRASKGRQDADGAAFSLNDFLTRWNDEGLSREAKSVLFDGETIAALDDLARVAQGTKEGQRFANFSNTGGANFLNFFLNGAPLGAVAGGVVPAAAAAGTSITAQVGLGRLLASPSFARWLAKMPKQPNQAAVRKHVMGLEKIAAADAAIASDALGLQRQLLGSLDQGAVPLAAEGQSEGSNTTGSGTR